MKLASGDRVSSALHTPKALALPRDNESVGRVLLSADVQLLRGRDEFEPPYGVVVLTRDSVVIGADEGREEIPLSSIESIACDDVGGLYHQLFGKKYIKLTYRKGKSLVRAPLFASAHGEYGGALGNARDMKTEKLKDEIESNLERLKGKTAVKKQAYKKSAKRKIN
jgi:hypothetical protein